MTPKLYTIYRSFQYEQVWLRYMIQYGQTKSASYLTSMMPVNTDVTNVTYIVFYQNMWCQ